MSAPKTILIIFLFIVLTLKPVGAQENPVVIMIGDSITSTSLHLPQWVTTHSQAQGLPYGPTVERLRALLLEKNIDATVLNYGWSGSTSLFGFNRIQSVIDEVKKNYPNRVYVLCSLYGTNDKMAGGYSAAMTRQYTQGIVDIAKKEGVIPLLGTLLPRTNLNILDYNQSIIEVAATNSVRLVNFQHHFPVDMLYDGLHPTFEGHELMADLWLPAVLSKVRVPKKILPPMILNILLNGDL